MAKTTDPPFSTRMPRFLYRGLLWYVILSMGFQYFGGLYATWMQPMIRSVMEMTSPAYHVDDIIQEKKALTYQVSIYRYVLGPGGVATGAGMQIHQPTPVSIFYIQPVMLLAVIMAWPGLFLAKRIRALIAGIFLLHLVVALDIPFHLTFAIEEEHAASAGWAQRGLLRWWGFLLNNGGRQVWALLGGVLCVLVSGGHGSGEHGSAVESGGAGRNAPCPCGSGRKYKKCCLSPGRV